MLWKASKDKIEKSKINEFSKLIEKKYNQKFNQNYKSFWEWSVANDEIFWNEYWDFANILGTKGNIVIQKDKKFYKNKFFSNSKLNFAKNLLIKKNNEIAIFSQKENGEEDQITWNELYEQVCKFSSYLKSKIKFGDRVAAYTPNTIETIIAFIACAKNGNIWSSCSPDFGVQGVIDRFAQIEPKIFITCDSYYYNGKKIDLLARIPEILKYIPSVQEVIVFSYKKDEDHVGKYISFSKIIKNQKPDENFEEFEFDHPVYILYSSGTTGKPKCIVHGAGNSLIEQKKELSIHCDVKDKDRLFYFTSTGWMMWNWKVGALCCGATIYLYDGNPFYPKIDRLIQYCAEHQFTLFGVGAKYIDHLKNEKFNAKSYDLSSLNTITSTGSPLVKESFEYVYQNIKNDVHLSSISGGTDVVGCIVLGNLFDPIYAGEIQCPSLAIEVAIYNENGSEVKNDEKGELVIKKPFPSMPVKFWNDPDESKIQNAYFNKFKNIWYHGDYIQRTINNGYIIYGRSDATLKPGGVRIGTAEIYRQVENYEGIIEALVVGQNYNDDVRIVLFVKMKQGSKLNDELIGKIKSKIRVNCSPRHVPQLIIECPDIPRTKSGKIVEIAVRKILNKEKIENLEALANPEILDFYQNLNLN